MEMLRKTYINHIFFQYYEKRGRKIRVKIAKLAEVLIPLFDPYTKNSAGLAGVDWSKNCPWSG